MIYLKRTTSEDDDFQTLVRLLDSDLALRNGDSNDFYTQYNKIDLIKHVIVYYDDLTPAGCGAFKAFDDQSAEIKRMFVKPENRGKRIGAAILDALEQWASELGYNTYVLETGKTNPEALRLYAREGYVVIPNYGQYQGVEDSICMQKVK